MVSRSWGSVLRKCIYELEMHFWACTRWVPVHNWFSDYTFNTSTSCPSRRFYIENPQCDVYHFWNSIAISKILVMFVSAYVVVRRDIFIFHFWWHCDGDHGVFLDTSSWSWIKRIPSESAPMFLILCIETMQPPPLSDLMPRCHQTVKRHKIIYIFTSDERIEHPNNSSAFWDRKL